MQLAGETMGTTWHVSYVSSDRAPKAEAVREGIAVILGRVNGSMSTYRRDSLISAVNTSPVDEWVEIDADFLTVLTAAFDVGSESAGAYDVTAAPLVDLWGFGSEGQVDTSPALADIELARARVGQHKIELDTAGMKLRKRAPVSLDFSSLAKGYAVDRIAEWLLGQGIDRFMVEVGGEMRLAGQSGRGDNWRIAIEQPDSRQRSVAQAISLTDVAVATSGDYRNYFEVDGERFSHLIDARTGYPVRHDLVSVTVVHPECMLADAWATALVVLGAEEAMRVAQAQGLAVYFIRRVGTGYRHSYTPQFSAFLDGPGKSAAAVPGE